MHHATVRLEASDAQAAEAVRRALQVELGDGPAGVVTALRCEGAVLVADLKAAELSGLRAAVTGLVRLGGAALAALGKRP